MKPVVNGHKGITFNSGNISERNQQAAFRLYIGDCSLILLLLSYSLSLLNTFTSTFITGSFISVVCSFSEPELCFGYQWLNYAECAWKRPTFTQETLVELDPYVAKKKKIYIYIYIYILKWVATSFSRGSSWSRNPTCIYCISCIGRWILYHWATREAPTLVLVLCFGKFFIFVFFIFPLFLPSFVVVHSVSCVRLFMTPMDCSMPGLPVYHQLLEFTQTHVHCISDVIWCMRCQPFHSLLSPSPSVFPSIRVFSSESFLCIRWPKY